MPIRLVAVSIHSFLTLLESKVLKLIFRSGTLVLVEFHVPDI